ncbi:MAG: hypothetical protein R2755_10025 [Acidimicrobiales bacterium]
MRTHLLTPVDDPVDVVRRYVVPTPCPAMLAIGESPLAIMQGWFRHPSEVVGVSWSTHRLCYLLSAPARWATLGLQTLIDLVGLRRVLEVARGAGASWPGATATSTDLGDQSRLIDDVTGTLPPYDRFLVPAHPGRRGGPVGGGGERHRGKGGDANDLGFVDVIGASSGVDAAVAAALRRNPARPCREHPGADPARRLTARRQP